MNSKDTTIIICCAGSGTRLGIGSTKALVDIDNKPLIIRLLESLSDYDDVRIVVGYQADKVIKTVNSYRKDVLFAFNRDYEKTGPAASMWKALKGARENVIIMDGDLVIEPESFKKFLDYPQECITYSNISTDEPVYIDINDEKAFKFNCDDKKFSWPGLIKINKNKISEGNNYIFETVKENLPMKAFKINCMEIDTQDDYEKVIKWFKNDYC